jgi:hypothetical protein
MHGSQAVVGATPEFEVRGYYRADARPPSPTRAVRLCPRARARRTGHTTGPRRILTPPAPPVGVVQDPRGRARRRDGTTAPHRSAPGGAPSRARARTCGDRHSSRRSPRAMHANIARWASPTRAWRASMPSISSSVCSSRCAPRPHMGSRGRRDTHHIEHMFEVKTSAWFRSRRWTAGALRNLRIGEAPDAEG